LPPAAFEKPVSTSYEVADFGGFSGVLPPASGRNQGLARKNYRLWQADASHPSLQFKRVGKKESIYSVRVGIGWRALGLVEGNTITWFWIGSHAEYDRLIADY
jgi:hypothetical protein